MQTDELLRRLELQHEIGIFSASHTDGHKVVSYGEAAAEIRRLTGQVEDASRTFHAIAAHDMGFSEDRNAARGWIERNGGEEWG